VEALLKLESVQQQWCEDSIGGGGGSISGSRRAFMHFKGLLSQSSAYLDGWA
jgi:hypothetical protein